MTLTHGLLLVVLCCLVPSLSLKEKSTDHRLIYQSEDIIKQQDAEEAGVRNASSPDEQESHSDGRTGEASSENAIEYVPEPKKVPTYGEVNHGKQTPTVVVHIPEGLPELCTLPKKSGKCRARMPRYFFNMKTKECERFIYGGCNGNDNRFLTIDECAQTCHLQTTL